MTFFTAEDFYTNDLSPRFIAQLANEKLQREAKVVYICDKEIKTLHFAQPVDATHTGILMCIEPLEKPKCEHDVIVKINLAGAYSATCNSCGAVMQPTKWEVAE